MTKSRPFDLCVACISRTQRATVGVTSNGFGEREVGEGVTTSRLSWVLENVLSLSCYHYLCALARCQGANRRPQTTNDCALQRSDNHQNIDDNNNKNNRNNNNANDNRNQAGSGTVLVVIKVINFVTQAAI